MSRFSMVGSVSVSRLLGILAILVLTACETARPGGSGADETFSLSHEAVPSVHYQYAVSGMMGRSLVGLSNQFNNLNGLEGMLLWLEPQSLGGVHAFPVPVERVSLEALAVGFGRLLGNGFAEVPGAVGIPRPDLAYPAVEYRFSGLNRENKPVDIYYTVVQLPGRAVLLHQIVSQNLNSVRAMEPAKRSSLQIEDLLPTGTRFTAGAAHPVPYGQFLNGLGLYYANRGNTARALEFFELATPTDPNNRDYVLNRGFLHYQRSEYDPTIALMEPAVDRFPDDLRMGRLLANAYLGAADPEAAIIVLEDLLADGDEDTETLIALFRTLIELRRYDDVLAHAESLAGTSRSFLGAMWTAVALRAQSELDAAAEALEPHLNAVFADSEAAGFLIDLTFQRQDFALGLVYADRLVERSGNPEFAFYQGLAYLNLGQLAAARDAFQSVLTANSGNFDARQHLSYVTNLLGENDPSLYNTPIEPVPRSPLLDTLDLTPPADYRSRTGAVGHFVGEAIHWEPGKPRRLTRYESFEVRHADALARMKEIVVPFNPLYEKIFVNQLHVFDAAGNRVGEGNPAQFYLSDPMEDNIADTRKSLHIPVPGLLTGGRYELILTREYLGPADELYFADYCFSGLHPRDLSFFQFTGALDRLAVHTNDLEIAQHEDGDTRLWVRRAPPLFERHLFLPPFNDYLPTVWISDAKNEAWAQLAQVYVEELAEVFGETPENIAAEAATLDLGDGSPEAIVKAVSDFMSERYTYTAINFGRHATLPHDPADICRDRFGDCKDFTVVMHHYLKALGLESAPALVKAQRGLIPALPGIDQFDHMVLHVPALGEHALVDPSDRFMGVGFPPRSILGEPVLVIAKDTTGLLPPVVVGPEANAVAIQRQLEIGADGVILGSESLTFRGHSAADFRGMLSTVAAEDYLASFQEMFLGFGVPLNLLEVTVENPIAVNEPLRLALRYRIPRGLHRAGEAWIGNLAGSWDYGYFLQPRTETTRNSPFEIYRGLHVELDTTVTWAEGLDLVGGEALEPAAQETVYGAFAYEPTNPDRQSRQFQTSTRATLQRGSFPHDAFEPFMDYLESVAVSLTPSVKFLPSAPPPPGSVAR